MLNILPPDPCIMDLLLIAPPRPFMHEPARPGEFLLMELLDSFQRRFPFLLFFQPIFLFVISQQTCTWCRAVITPEGLLQLTCGVSNVRFSG